MENLPGNLRECDLPGNSKLDAYYDIWIEENKERFTREFIDTQRDIDSSFPEKDKWTVEERSMFKDFIIWEWEQELRYME